MKYMGSKARIAKDTESIITQSLRVLNIKEDTPTQKILKLMTKLERELY